MRRGKVRVRHGEDGLKVLDRILAGEGCDVCGRRFENTKFMHIDHDHATGEVRGLLCSNCNTALGLLRESPDTIGRLLEYLERKKVS